MPLPEDFRTAAGDALAAQANGAPDTDPDYVDSLLSDDRADDLTESEKQAQRLRNRIVVGLELTRLPRPTWLVDGIIPRPSVGMLYAPPKSGKTFATIDLAASVATGREWMDRACVPGPVVYVIGEGVGGVGARLDAWAEYNGRTDLDGVHWHQGPVHLANHAQVAALADYCREIGAVLIVLDTLARCTVGMEENSAKDMGEVVAALDRLREASGAAVLVVHHSGKDKTRGARGSSALLGAVDFALEMTKSDTTVRLTVDAMKDADDGDSFAWHLEPVAESAVLVPGGGVGGVGSRQPAQTEEVLDILREIATAEGVAPGVWLRACEGSVKERTFRRIRKHLEDVGRIKNLGSD